MKRPRHSQQIHSIASTVIRDYRGFEPRSTDIQPMHIMSHFFLRLPCLSSEASKIKFFIKFSQIMYFIYIVYTAIIRIFARFYLIKNYYQKSEIFRKIFLIIDTIIELYKFCKFLKSFFNVKPIKFSQVFFLK